MALPILEASSTLGFMGPSHATNVLSRSWPAGHQPGWVALCIAITPNLPVQAPGYLTDHLLGFTECPNSPIGTGTTGNNAGDILSTRITAHWLRATSASMPNLVFRKLSTDDHVIFRYFFFSSVFATGTPFLTLSGASANVITSASNAVSIPGGDTTGFPDVLALNIATHALDTSSVYFNPTWVNAALANINVIANESNGAGNGSGYVVVSGEKATAGVYGATTGTMVTGITSVQARLSLALRGTAAAVVVDDSDFACGGECGQDGMGGGHWHGEGGTPFTSQTDYVRNGGRAFRSAPSQSTSFRFRNVTGAQRVGGFSLRWVNELPSTDCELARFRAGNGFSPELRYRAATKDVVAAIGTAVSPAVAVAPGVFYDFGMYADVSVNPRVVKLAVGGVDQGQATLAVTPSTFDRFEIGASITTPTTADMAIDDVRIGPKLSVYPFPLVSIVGIHLIGDGAHNYGTLGDFKYNNLVNVPLGATDLYTYMAGLLTRDFLKALTAGTAGTGEYIEMLAGGMPAATTIPFVEAVSLHRGTSSSAHKQSLRLLDSTGTVDLGIDESFAGTTPKWKSVHLLKAPSGVAWTQALVNALKVRWASSFTAALTGGEIGGFMLEVGATGLASGPVNGPNVQNPTFTYAAAGTYAVTLKVKDQDGLTAQVTKNVTVV